MIDYDIYVHTLFFKEKVAEFDKSFCQGIEDAWCWRGRTRPRPISFFFFFLLLLRKLSVCTLWKYTGPIGALPT